MREPIIKIENYQSEWSKFLVISIGMLCLIFVDKIFIHKILWYYDILLNFLLIFSVGFIFNFGKKIIIENGFVQIGKYISVVNSFKVEKQIKKSDIIQIDMIQNSKKMFEIVIISYYDSMIIKTLPNKIHAQKELQKIRDLILHCD